MPALHLCSESDTSSRWWSLLNTIIQALLGGKRPRFLSPPDWETIVVDPIVVQRSNSTEGGFAAKGLVRILRLRAPATTNPPFYRLCFSLVLDVGPHYLSKHHLHMILSLNLCGKATL